MPETDMKLSADAITELFAATDRGDVEAVTGFFRNDVEVFFGNNDPFGEGRPTQRSTARSPARSEESVTSFTTSGTPRRMGTSCSRG
jgi:ketosteroid isomerase-like protein